MKPVEHFRLAGTAAGEAWLAGLLWLAATGLTVAACRLHNTPTELAPCWLAGGLVVTPAVRWRLAQVLPAALAALWLGTWLGDATGWRTLLAGLVTVLQAGAVAWGLRHTLPRMRVDRRPLYRVRLAHLAWFLFAFTLPASLAGGLAIASIDLAAGGPSWAAWRAFTFHAAASGLAIAALAPLLWWNQLRSVSWRVALVASVLAGGLSVLAVDHPQLFWLVPPVVILAGYCGATWAAVVAVVCAGAGLLVHAHLMDASAYGGPGGFGVWLLVVWRLLTAGLLASLWSERRSRVIGQPEPQGTVHPTPQAALRDLRTASRPAAAWFLVLLDDLAPAGAAAWQRHLPAGSSLATRVALDSLAARLRDSDLVVGVGACGAVLLLAVDPANLPAMPALALRLRGATHAGLAVQAGRQLDAAAVRLLLQSARHFEEALDGG